MSIVLSPLVKWAQDRRALYLTVEISNGVVKKLEIGEKSINFQGYGNGAHGENIYKLDLTLNDDIVPKICTNKVTDRHITITLRKKEAKYWDKLLMDDKKPGWLKIDFDRWRDEDDSAEEIQEEITNISIEHRKKEMEADIDKKVKEAEQEVKELVLKGYLLIYNVLQGLAFFYITFVILGKLLVKRTDAVPGLYDDVSDLLATCQIAAFIEPINAWFKFVRTGVLAPFSQCLGRFIVLFLVITPHPELQKSVLTVVLFLVWSLIENIRYPFYSLQTVGYCPKWLLWLRYTAWIPLYPVGIICEELCIYQAAKLFDSTGRWTLSVSFLGEVSIPFSLFLRIYMIILALGGSYLIKHMWSLRVRTSKRRLKTKHE